MAKRGTIKPDKREWWNEFHDDIHQKAKTRKGGKDMQMSNKSTNEPKVTKAKYAKTRGEHTKDIIIAVLITGVIAFGFGMYFEHNRNTEMQNAVSAALTVKK